MFAAFDGIEKKMLILSHDYMLNCVKSFLRLLMHVIFSHLL